MSIFTDASLGVVFADPVPCHNFEQLFSAAQFYDAWMRSIVKSHIHTPHDWVQLWLLDLQQLQLQGFKIFPPRCTNFGFMEDFAMICSLQLQFGICDDQTPLPLVCSWQASRCWFLPNCRNRDFGVYFAFAELLVWQLKAFTSLGTILDPNVFCLSKSVAS